MSGETSSSAHNAAPKDGADGSDRKAGSAPPSRVREPASERILAAATELFKARGYHGTSMRELAQSVGIEAASVYYHFPSKQEILAALFDQTMDDLLTGLLLAMASGSSAEARLRAVVRFHVLIHIERQDDAFISHSELRSLSPHNRDRIVTKRDEYERRLRALLAAGVDDGEFEIPDLRLTSTAILMMCSGVSDWFEKDGRLEPDTVANCYEDMVMRLVGASSPRRQGE